jgi:glycosyltransferase involved in cell wall biosynthesis
MLRKLIEVLSSGCICVGAFISKYYGTNCDAVVYGGASRIEFHPWSEKRRIAWVGRLGSDFPVIEFARMVKILRDRFGIDLIVEIVGDGPLRKALSCFAEQSKLNFVFHGFVEDPAPYVVSVDMVFAPGYLSMIEAMALGRPVLSIHNNAFRQDYLIPMPVSKAAILAPNAEELASAVAELYSDTSRLQMIGRRGFDLVSRMTWGSIAEVYMKLYEKTTGRIEKALVASLVLL